MEPFSPDPVDCPARRKFLLTMGNGLAATALGTLLNPSATSAAPLLGRQPPNFPAKAKRIIYLFFCGGPSHIDTFDYKPVLRRLHGKELPASVRQGQRLTGMTSKQRSFPCVAPMFNFNRFGQVGSWVNSDLLPATASIMDDITIVKSVHTEAINHDPAITYINTGVQQQGKPCLGSWLSYGLGSENNNMPTYVVMISKGGGQAQGLFDRLWGSGFLPSQHQGVKFRSRGEPVLYLKNPPGVDHSMRRDMLDTIQRFNARNLNRFKDPETRTRMAQYEMAYRMQAAVPDVMDVSKESKSAKALYGPDVDKPGSFARNALLARRMAERGVRFVQLYHRGWDQHTKLPKDLPRQCRDVDRACAALIHDLKQRGMFDDTLVVCAGEFGRTIYSQGKLTRNNHGRDHHGRCFTVWLAGAGIKRGFEYGRTDDYCYNVIENPVHISDLNATILHQMGLDHEKLTYRHQGLDQRLTNFKEAHVIKDILV